MYGSELIISFVQHSGHINFIVGHHCIGSNEDDMFVRYSESGRTKTILSTGMVTGATERRIVRKDPLTGSNWSINRNKFLSLALGGDCEYNSGEFIGSLFSFKNLKR